MLDIYRSYDRLGLVSSHEMFPGKGDNDDDNELGEQKDQPMTAAALSDLRELDLSSHVAGPFCTKLFADFGADVIKVEVPGEGDTARYIGPFPNDTPDLETS